ncbi:MAG TPA: DUF4010 domain-containing protein [Burkholderiaceae bacterium]|nr:DUF4010 domain-containing protein [Burkholderiaceae bacterium]
MGSAGWIGLLVALGVGLLVGVERERRKGRGPSREAAGLRTFALASVAGALAQSAAPGALVAAGAAGVAALAALAYWRSMRGPAPQRDPGVTTELALLVTYLVGVQCAVEPAVGAGCGALLTALLAARERLHRWATEALTDLELRDALVLTALALVIVPLAPTAPWPWLGGLAPRTVAWLVLVILGLQALAHLAQRVIGARRALRLAGLLGGFVSSTATIATYGARARSQRAPMARHLAGAATLSGTATWVQSMVLAALVSPALLPDLWGPAATGAVVCVAAGLWWGRDHGAIADAPPTQPQRPLRVREALWVAALLLGVSVAITALQSQFGARGLLAGTALAALADAHSPIAAAFGLHAGGTLTSTRAAQALLLAIGVNTVSRSVVALAAGGAAYGARVASALFASTAAATLVARVGLV